MGSPGPRESNTVTVRFLDDEIMEGRIDQRNLEEPNIVLELEHAATNNERALVPLPSIKRITFDAGTPSKQQQERATRKVAIRFQDGEVLKGYLDGELDHATHGITIRLMTVEKDRVETLGIPYTALKALFYVKSWDSRPPEFDGEIDLRLSKRLSSPLVDLMSNIGELEKLRKRGTISESEFQRKRKRILDNI
jgi:hypothetical protein